MFKNRKSSFRLPEINASSTADIAFLLLIFFLVASTMDMDKGLLIQLPPMVEEELVFEPASKNNVLEILVNKNDALLVEGGLMEINELREMTKKHVNNHGKDPHFSSSPLSAIVSLKNDRATSYDMYIMVLNEVRAAYNELRDEFALSQFERQYDGLDKVRKKYVAERYPLRISEAEPDDFGI